MDVQEVREPDQDPDHPHRGARLPSWPMGERGQDKGEPRIVSDHKSRIVHFRKSGQTL